MNSSQNGSTSTAAPLQGGTGDLQSLPFPTSQTVSGQEVVESPKDGPQGESLSSMSELDRYGLAGLLHMIRNENSDMGALAVGQDLTTLGLDLNQHE